MHSRTEMCLLDIQTQRFMRLSSVGVEESMISRHSMNEIVFAKFEEIDAPMVEKVTVKSTNIDFSHHTNNAEYIRLITNTYSVNELETRVMKEVEILYLNQSYEGDILEIKKAKFPQKDIIFIEKSGKPIVKCEIIF